ncbi:SusC/RagA family TonB-linked outer membrane protein [Mucilaginibacter sp. X4EP1]|uniref:SusC/RagA family TonB-linked outer membrane protein n=1 Tax=Mucilaginibacter sp. X4EP1 TaxID=2723092 RepID=UPI00216959D2|nr:SusC/RagA family TonB-linked outer membrane protein [Mucilaginibacter sp. X4EP1]MCS3814609.1 TonB-linked SusC/RagA family outer membrane protein [Mucilaginibacter sp. X4EP1]
MKLTTIILIVTFLHVSAAGIAQKITYKNNSASLEQIFKEIRKQTGYNVLVSSNKIKDVQPQAVNFEDASLKEVLDMALKGQPLTYNIEDKTILIRYQPAPNVSANVQPPLTGKVVDSTGVPLPGASVKIKGTNIGQVTDVNGKFSLEAPVNSVLIVSYIGFETREITVKSNAELTIVLSSSNSLQTVVVTALGIKKEERRVGYSITQVSGEEVSTTREPTFVNALAGKVAGLVVQTPPNGPGGSSRVILRGYSSFSGSNQPLYVIDGVPINSDTRENSNDQGKIYGGSDPGDGLNSINPDDIESISVLKGASAAALYGGGAQAGVILITTKKGKKGAGVGISFNSNMVFEKMIPYDNLQTEYGRGYYGRTYTAADDTVGFFYGGLGNNSGDPPGWSWGAKIEGQPFLDIDGKVKPYVLQSAAENFDRFYKIGITTTNSLALTKGYDDGSYRISVSDTRDDSPTPGEGYERYNAVFTLNQDYGKRLHTSFKVDLSRVLRLNAPLERGDGRGSMGQSYPRIANTTDIRLLDEKDADGNFLSTYTANPYVELEKVKNDQTQNRVLTSGNITYDITNHFHVNFIAGLDYINTGGVFAVYPNNVTNNNGIYSTSSIQQQKTDVRSTLNYDDKFKDFTLNVLAGVESQNSLQNSLALSGSNFVDPSQLNFNNLKTINNPTELHSPRYETNSIFASADLGYKNYLFLEITGRNDWYSALTSNLPNFKNYLFYPSTNLSYVFSDALHIDPKVLSFGKLRASYGQTGSNPTPQATNLTFTSQGTVNGIPLSEVTNDSAPPDHLQPEVTTESEIGTELKFFGNRIGVDFDYYYKKSHNFLLPITLSNATTFSSVYVNAGDMYNKGIELLLTGSPIKTQNFGWDVSINMAKNKNMVTALAPGLGTGIDIYYNIEARVGYPLGSIFGSTYQRAPNGQIVYQPENSQTGDSGTPNSVIIAKNSGDNYLGTANPDWSGGITNTFTYKNFSFSFLIDGQFGGQVYEADAVWTNYFGNSKASLLGRDGTYIPNGVVNTGTASAPVYTKNTLPYSAYIQFNDNGNADKIINESNIFSRTFIKFRQVSLGYNIPKSILAKTFIRSATFSLIGRNLFYIKKDLPTFDPEASDSIGNGFGYDSGGSPVSRTYGFNLNINF